MEQTLTAPQERVRKDVYTIVTEKIIAQLEKGTIPWRQPWVDEGIPRNLISKRPYRGINLMLLSVLDYEENFFLTYKQLTELGGWLKPEEKPHLVVFWNYDNKEQDTDHEGEKQPKKKALLRYYTVYNVAQCEGIPTRIFPKVNPKPETIPECERIVTNMPQKPKIQFKEAQAYYDPIRDFVNMPKQKSFKDDESYYSVLFHELLHSTGHQTRLNRPQLIQMAEFGSNEYSLEELTAEIGTCYLQSYSGITSVFEQSVAYIDGWLQKLKSDRKFIFTAAMYAQKAVDFILGYKGEEHSEE